MISIQDNKSAQVIDHCQVKIYRIKRWLLVKLICLAVHSTEMVMVKWWCVLLENKWQCIRWLLICFPTMLGGQYRCNSNTYNFHLRRKDTLVYNFHDLSSLVYNFFWHQPAKIIMIGKRELTTERKRCQETHVTTIKHPLAWSGAGIMVPCCTHAMV